MDSRYTRRDFVARFLVAATVIPVGTFARLANGSHETRVQEDWVGRARSQLPTTAESSYFQTGAIGPCPQPVIDEIAERLAFQNRGPADPRYYKPMSEIEPDLRSCLADTFGVGPTGVALTHSTSEGISIAAWSLNWAEGDEVIISNQEHPSNIIPWYVLRDRYGLVIREINLDAGTSLLDQVRDTLSTRTRMLSISHVGRNNGRRIRTEESAVLAEVLRARDIVYHLDGAQGPGCVPVNFLELGCNCYSTCGHKWLLGPKGTGAFFVREDAIDRIQLSWAGAHSHSDMDYEGSYTLRPSAARYEFGTRALSDYAGFRRAITWMQEFGLDRVLTRIQYLVGYAIDRIEQSDRLAISSPKNEEDRSGVLVVRLPDGCDALTVYKHLSGDPKIITSPVRTDGDLRLAIHFFNTEEEIDAAIEAIEGVC
jgi:selenocysteine lyase/cysteine desulfurase